VSTTRLHAKSWLFERASGFSTAYIGSSNLTHSAQHAGLEWNVRVSGPRNPGVLEKIRAVFESYWASPDFREYNPEEFGREVHADRTPWVMQISPLAVELRPFQERLLEQIALARQEGLHRNLLVSATGTGKTVMAAVDYARLRRSLPRHRLLFVAHREEILTQSMATFRHVLREPGFGALWNGRNRPDTFEHVFASIQSLHSERLELLPPDHFDCIIIDEFHHAAAPTYQALLAHLQPVELLGLTATPERADGQSILEWFEDRIAAELRLWDAIDQQLLTPFQYFGLHDGMDLSRIPWRRGAGYDVDELTRLYTASDVWAEFVLKEFTERVPDPATVRALGFCVSVRHAEAMARIFNRAGVACAAVSAQTPAATRQQALRDLAGGAIRVLFSVDLFNEGVDVPAVDALMLLRPTESSTLFIQQLGRGLRKGENKTVCTVLDFVGTHRREFRFDLRLRALLGGTRKELEENVERGFPYLPAGCHMELDAKSQRIVLESIRSALPSHWKAKVTELHAFLEAGHRAELSRFLFHSGLELADVFFDGKTWSALCRDAGAGDVAGVAGPYDEILRKAVVRLMHVDDTLRIDTTLGLLKSECAPVFGELGALEQRLVRMLLVQLCQSLEKSMLPVDATPDDALALLWRHPAIRLDLSALFEVLRSRIGHLHYPITPDSPIPLRVHAQYTRSEILAAFGVGEGVRPEAWREGVRWIEAEQTDVFLVTFDKTGGRFSPSTRYKDYAISRDLLHWESQSTTSENSPTGRRYQGRSHPGARVVLFARLNDDSRAFWCLGTARYVRHTGERPMAIIWRLDHPLPGDLFQKFAAAVA
jgi:superfamily II DNA or RNA helicase